MEFFPSVLNFDESKAMVENIESKFDREGFGLWAVELLGDGRFIGFVGLSEPKFQAHFTPCVEVGWRIAREYWGSGYATEAAKVSIQDGFERLSLPEIVSLTAAINKKSIRIMEKIGMKQNPADDFLHPLIDDGHILKPHVLYRLGKSDWLSRNGR